MIERNEQKNQICKGGCKCFGMVEIQKSLRRGDV